MSEKGCVFEMSTEFKAWEDFLLSLTRRETVSPDLIRRITKDILNVSVEHVLNSRLSDTFKTDLNLEDAVIKIINAVLPRPLPKQARKDVEDFVYDINQDISDRLIEMFHDVDMTYALWTTKQLSSKIVLVEYGGDFRIMEWHSSNGIPYKNNTDARYEFSVGWLYNQLDHLLTPHRSRYAGQYLTKCLDSLARVIIEEAVFSPSNKAEATAENAACEALGKLTLDDFCYTRREFENYFPLMCRTDVDLILGEVETALQNDLLLVINATIELSNVINWFISGKILTITVDQPLVKVDFEKRVKDDILASIANGDWVPPKMRSLADQ